MPNSYCVLCGNRDKSVSYYRFPKNVELCKKWLAFCDIDKPDVLNTVTKLCSNHFQEGDIICRAKGTILKPNAVPCIIIKKRKVYLDQYLNVIIHKDCLKKLKNCDNGTVDDTCSMNDVDVKDVYLTTIDNGTVTDKTVHDETADEKNFISVDEDLTASFPEPSATVKRPCTPPSCESTRFQIPVKATHDHLPRYIGDIRMSHLATPTRAKRTLQFVKCIITKQQRKIKTLQQARNRLVARLTLMKGLVKHLQQQNLQSKMTAENLITQNI
ncbi:hypothetical protein DMN91_005288 [Ooceraea biroi]|uniref:THAP-type domain-containing protein n=1 Tax=Ooceraea biroi TaxID=2015173 RepID=A0A026WVE6_OOCBI|nr:uncharacterized protein LOC105275154 [Ooceraea biroi]EZA59606.1 hypothetical protein X777_16776 [Ooceraea biroi]RLU23010.1 hypothetical protein DMN91_005288 [Ooceraea biroi]